MFNHYQNYYHECCINEIDLVKIVHEQLSSMKEFNKMNLDLSPLYLHYMSVLFLLFSCFVFCVGFYLSPGPNNKYNIYKDKTQRRLVVLVRNAPDMNQPDIRAMF